MKGTPTFLDCMLAAHRLREERIESMLQRRGRISPGDTLSVEPPVDFNNKHILTEGL